MTVDKPSYGDNDPIAATATPLGESALALIRTSGGGPGRDVQSAVELLARVFSRPEKLLSAPPNSVVHGWIIESASGSPEKIDEVLVSVYRGPRSYTGEDGADISCHGGIAAVKAVLAALKKAGFREALPGEFTFRSFMNGKLDLTRAESVMELVAAKTNRGREQAVRRLAGALEQVISAIKNLLVEILAAAEIYLDYSEDEFIAPLPDRKPAEEAADRLRRLSELWRRERIYAEGALAVLAGRPNAGKSSLFNYLLREDRSIVTNVPGTTRDWIEALISVNDIPLRLADTAGLRKLDAAKVDEAQREPENLGIQRSLELLEKADLVLYVIDGEKGFTGEDGEFLSSFQKTGPEKPILILWNKADLSPLPASSQWNAVTAKTGEGILALMQAIGGRLESASASQEATGPGTARQKELIDSALASVDEALALTDRGEPLDIVASLYRSAINALGEITGEVSNADILEVMFSRFCVGK